MTEHPDQYPLFKAKSFLLHKFKLQDSGQIEKEKVFDKYVDKEEARKEIEKANDQFIKEHPDQNSPTNCKTGRNLEEEEKAENKFREEMINHKRKAEEKARNSEIFFYPSLLFKSFVKTNAFGVDTLKPALLF